MKGGGSVSSSPCLNLKVFYLEAAMCVAPRRLDAVRPWKLPDFVLDKSR